MVLVDLAAGVEFMGRASVQGVNAFVVIVEPGGRSIETANNVAKMARELGIKNVAAIANKITETTQTDLIQSQLKDVSLLGSVPYSSSVQKADLEFKPVFSTCPELVEALKDAKEKLKDLVNTDQEQLEIETKPLSKTEGRT
jgi:CO dehydrogenase maturation factor